MAADKPKKLTKEEREHRRREDAVMGNLAQLMLDEPEGYYRIERETRDAIWRRLGELLAREQARRPVGRPRGGTGELVENLIKALPSKKGAKMSARKLAARIKKIKLKSVERRHREHKQRGRGGGN